MRSSSWRLSQPPVTRVNYLCLYCLLSCPPVVCGHRRGTPLAHGASSSVWGESLVPPDGAHRKVVARIKAQAENPFKRALSALPADLRNEELNPKVKEKCPDFLLPVHRALGPRAAALWLREGLGSNPALRAFLNLGYEFQTLTASLFCLTGVLRRDFSRLSERDLASTGKCGAH